MQSNPFRDWNISIARFLVRSTKCWTSRKKIFMIKTWPTDELYNFPCVCVLEHSSCIIWTTRVTSYKRSLEDFAHDMLDAGDFLQGNELHEQKKQFISPRLEAYWQKPKSVRVFAAVDVSMRVCPERLSQVTQREILASFLGSQPSTTRLGQIDGNTQSEAPKLANASSPG